MPSSPDRSRDGGTPVLLLKTRSTPTDDYEERFAQIEAIRFSPRFVAVLEHQFYDDALSWVQSIIEEGCFTPSRSTVGKPNKFGGIIFTSQRAVDAFSKVISNLSADQRRQLLPEEIYLFVVGPATAKGVRSLQLGCRVMGEETGNGDALADFILEHYQTAWSLDGSRLPLLFLVGEQRRDIIPKKLAAAQPEPARVPVVERIVYGTAERDDFGDEFEEILQRRPLHSDLWVVVFSPSGCRAMLKKVGWLDGEGKYDEKLAKSRSPGTYVATIGPTTRDFLNRQFSFQPHVCAETPSPEGVARGILDYIEAHK
ncbi:Uroporphyrinogen-III synthase [Sphaceloma murrayae]|uniref:Uroporphyrinogen-III synthase n=1 Tax=Sphaceloma murrayae TaxID=2082308 RepID=A0A2K1R0A5_9PEZI|nr:Uroporphyrinogen-III synthase [Sphaceloma murrayae]